MASIVKPHTEVRTDAGSTGTFYLADCRDVLADRAEASVDVMVTSPPYNLGIRYNTKTVSSRTNTSGGHRPGWPPPRAS